MSRIAILSDTHDRLEVLHTALEQINAAGCSTLLHCGDLCAPFVVNDLADRFTGQIHIVFGNNDADGRLLQLNANKFDHVSLHGIYAELKVDGRAIAMIHYPEPARRIAQSGQLDLVVYGHNHRKHAEQLGACWLVNPGEIIGLVDHPTWALYDTDSTRVEIHDVNAPGLQIRR